MPNLIELKNITKKYAMGSEIVNALNGVSLNIAEGEYVAIMGASGSGKSTLMHIIGCLDTPSSGEYYLSGKAIQDCSDDELASVRNAAIGFIFQQFNLLPQMTGLQNVELPLIYGGADKEARSERAKMVMQMVGLGDRMNHRPTQLSGGQQQRVSIARALANRPKILLADEPTGALDSHTATDIMSLINDLVADGMTVVLVTHDSEVAAHAQRIVRLKDGVITSDERKAASRQ
jgi:putative ABC transport system ATP-binding protein